MAIANRHRHAMSSSLNSHLDRLLFVVVPLTANMWGDKRESSRIYFIYHHMKISQFDFGRRSLFARKTRKISVIFLLFRIFIFRANEYWWHVGLLDIFDYLIYDRANVTAQTNGGRYMWIGLCIFIIFNFFSAMALDRYEIFNVKSIYFLSKYFTTTLKILLAMASAFTFVWKEKGREKKRCAQPGATSHNTNNVLPVSSKFFPKV